MKEAKDGASKWQAVRAYSGMACAGRSGPLSALILLETLTFLPKAWANISAQSFQTHSHVVLATDPAVTYEVVRVEKNGKTVAFKLILGNLKEDLDDLSRFSDERTQKVRASRIRGDSGLRMVYEFSLTPQAQGQGVEYFDYRNKAPSEISLDYWLKKKSEPKKQEKKIVKKDMKKAAASHRTAGRHALKSVPQAIANGCGKPLSFATDAFALFKIYHQSFNYKGFFALDSADANYKYPKASGSKEADHYRLILKLYKEEKYALTLRAIDFFETQYRKSILVPELEFVKAGTLVKLSRLLKADRYWNQAIDLYRRLVLDAPDSERGRNALAFITQELMDHGSPMLALEYALSGAGKKSDDPRDMTRFVFRLAAAEALFALGEYDRAERSYQYLVEQNNAISVEAAFRLGEAFSARKFHERAMIAYEKAIQSYPEDSKRFPSVFFNLAESYFRLERYEDASRVFSAFEKHFANDPNLWAAALRVAEIEQMKIKSQDPKKSEAIKKMYESIVNRFPYSPGAAMAELRLSKCMSGLKASDPARDFFTGFFTARELKRFESPLVQPADVELWMDLGEARFFEANGDYRSALKRIDDYRPKLKRIPLGPEFKKIYERSLMGLLSNIDPKDAKQLLALSQKYEDLVPQPEPFSFGLSILKAKQVTGDLAGVSEQLKKLEGKLPEATDAEKDAFRFAKAQQERLVGERPDVVMADLNDIRDEGELAAAKYDALAQSSVDKKDLRAAIAYDNKLLDSRLADKLSPDRRLDASVRRLENISATSGADESFKLADRILLKFGAYTQYGAALQRVKEIRAKALYDAHHYKAAVEGLDEILGVAPDHPRHAEFEFMRGKALAQLGRDNEAFETFRKLAQASAADVWKKSAQEELDQLQWEKSVPRTINGRQEVDRGSNGSK